MKSTDFLNTSALRSLASIGNALIKNGGWVFTDGCSDLSLLIKSLSGNW